MVSADLLVQVDQDLVDVALDSLNFDSPVLRGVYNTPSHNPPVSIKWVWLKIIDTPFLDGFQLNMTIPVGQT